MPASDIRLDVFPVNVTTGDGKAWSGVRLVIAGSEGYMFGRTGAGPTLFATIEGVGNVDQPHYPLAVETDAGVMVVARAGGCGCSDPTKSWNVNRLLALVPA